MICPIYMVIALDIYGNRTGAMSRPESLYRELENHMSLNSGSAGARLGTSSGP